MRPWLGPCSLPNKKCRRSPRRWGLAWMASSDASTTSAQVMVCLWFTLTSRPVTHTPEVVNRLGPGHWALFYKNLFKLQKDKHTTTAIPLVYEPLRDTQATESRQAKRTARGQHFFHVQQVKRRHRSTHGCTASQPGRPRRTASIPLTRRIHQEPAPAQPRSPVSSTGGCEL
jgi:hypothetical protein